MLRQPLQLVPLTVRQGMLPMHDACASPATAAATAALAGSAMLQLLLPAKLSEDNDKDASLLLPPLLLPLLLPPPLLLLLPVGVGVAVAILADVLLSDDSAAVPLAAVPVGVLDVLAGRTGSGAAAPMAALSALYVKYDRAALGSTCRYEGAI